ncbi:MAG: STAS domain-containing protein [Planctomycetota bacterium]|jgi:anti-anti-sigma factor
MEFHFDEIDEDLIVIIADGGLNSSTAEEFVSSIGKLVDAGLRKIIVDCSGLDYISSYGLGILIRLHRRMSEHGGNVKLSNVRGMLPEILQLTRLNRHLGIFPSVDAARLSFRPADA